MTDLTDLANRIVATLSLLSAHGQVEGQHHKAWVIDQSVRLLVKTPADYGRFVESWQAEYGAEWDRGIAP